jgi:hypothetical protein
MHRIIIAGGRDFKNPKLLEKTVISYILENIGKGKRNEITIVGGKAKGADSLGEEFAKKYGLEFKPFPANWDKYGKAAGHIRNKEMMEFAKQEEGHLIAFWDGKSRGTKNMVEISENILKIKIVKY